MNEIDAMMYDDGYESSKFLDEFNRSQRASVQNLFDLLGFPLPQKGEFHAGDAAIVFCNPFGFSMRFNRASRFPLLRHSHLIRPLGAIDLGEHRLEFQPLLPTLGEVEIAHTVWKNLDRDGILTQDIKSNPSNSLCLTIATQDFPNGYPVVLDPYSLQCFNEEIRSFSRILQNNIIDLRPINEEQPDIQDDLFGDLREKFLALSEAGSQGAVQERFYTFLDACSRAKFEGRLCDRTTLERETRMPSQAAIAYESSLWKACDYFEKRTCPDSHYG